MMSMIKMKTNEENRIKADRRIPLTPIDMIYEILGNMNGNIIKIYIDDKSKCLHTYVNDKGFLLYKELSDRFKIDVPHHLRNEDRNSMSYGIESRPLFLDHELLETVWSFPYELLMYSGTNKYLLRQIMKNTLNEKVLNFRKKYVRPGNNKATSY